MLLTYDKCCQQDIKCKLLWLDWPWLFQIHCFFTISTTQSITWYRFPNTIFKLFSVSYWKDKLIFWVIGAQKVQWRKMGSVRRTVPQTFLEPTACSYQHAWTANKGPRPAEHLSTGFNFKHVPKCFAGKGPKERMSTVNWKALQNWPDCFVCPFQLLVNTHLDLTHPTRIATWYNQSLHSGKFQELERHCKTHLGFRLLRRHE